MTRISNADHVLLLLKAQLDQLRRAKLTGRRSEPAPAAKRRSSLERITHLALDADLSEADLSRAHIAALLSDEFGPAVANDTAFQSVVDSVLAAIRADETGVGLLTRAVQHLASSR